MFKILVTGAGGSASYNFINSLRHNPEKEKFYIVGADSRKYHIELAGVDKRYILPRADHPDYLEKLNKLIKLEKIDFLHPQPDPEVNFIAKNKRRIKTKTFLPKYETIRACQDKMEFNRILKKAELAVPEAYYINSKQDLRTALNRIFKSNEKAWLRATSGAGSKAALPVKEYAHAEMWIDYWKKMKGVGYGSFMVSEFLPGKEYAWQSLWHKGKLIASQARERVEYIFGNLTPSGQSSSPSVAVTVNSSEINNTATKAVKAIDPNATGIFCADLKTDKENKIVLMEINSGRFFTTSYFFSRAGCNMPYYYTKMGLEGKRPENLKPFDNIPSDWHWVRMIDMGYKLIKKNKWTSHKI